MRSHSEMRSQYKLNVSSEPLTYVEFKCHQRYPGANIWRNHEGHLSDRESNIIKDVSFNHKCRITLTNYV